LTGRGTPAQNAVELFGIARRFGRRWALRGVTLHVEPGEVLGVVGHNGSGKTTLLRVVATALRPSHGSGKIFGFDLLSEPGRVRETIALLGHRPGIYEDLTAAENLQFAARMLGVGDERNAVARALSDVGLEREANERARNFSSGMQRRLSLARVLLQQPRLLLLDEPYHSFDADGVLLVNDVIRATRKRGGSAMIVTHDMGRAADVIDRTIELAKGVALEDASDSPAVLPLPPRRAATGTGLN
jgi:heme exporter protein A